MSLNPDHLKFCVLTDLLSVFLFSQAHVRPQVYIYYTQWPSSVIWLMFIFTIGIVFSLQPKSLNL